MNKNEMLKGLNSGRKLIQNKDCSSSQEISDVNNLVEDGVAHATEWDFGNCRSCGFNELQRIVSKASKNGG